MANVFNIGARKILDGSTDLDGAGILEMALYTTSPAVDLTDAQNDLASMAAVEADAGFTEAADATYLRVALTGFSFNTDDGNNRAEAIAGDVVFSGLDNDLITGAIIFDEGGATEATRYPVAYYNLADTQTVGTDFTVVVPATGYLWLTTL